MSNITLKPELKNESTINKNLQISSKTNLFEQFKKTLYVLNTYNIFKVIAFPVFILWLELILHIFMNSNMKYFPIYSLFSFSLGFLFSSFFMIIPYRISKIVSVISSVILSLLYTIEFIARIILQTYYQPSTLGVAMGNNLTDYYQVIIDNILSNLMFIVLAFSPCFLIYVFFRRKHINNEKKFSLICIIAVIVFHIFGVTSTKFFVADEINPAYLYNTDTNIDDQVEQLGLYTMIRLDIKHMMIPPKSDNSNMDFVTTDMKSISSDNKQTNTPHVIDVDLKAMAEKSTDSSVKYLANYFQSVSPTYKNKYTGMFKGYNVIFFTLEGFSGYVIDKELTPTLYKLSTEGFVFKNFYSALHYTSTSNGECQNLLGLYPKNGNPISMRRTGELKTNIYFGLANQLEREGYTNIGYHNNGNMYGRNLSHPNLGYDWRYHNNGLEYESGTSQKKALWPQRDSYMIEVSVDDYIDSSTPFHIYYLTITGHTPYTWNWTTQPYKESLIHLKHSEQTKAYIATAIEVDKMMETLIEKLDKSGKLENTLIIAAPDHIPYSDVEILEELTGNTFGSSDSFKAINEANINFDVYKNSLIIWSASMKSPVEIDKVVCQVDILPTISNLLDLKFDSRMLAGSDALSDREGLVIFSSRCWKTDRGFYNRFNQSFTPAKNIKMTQKEIDEYVENMKKIVGYKLDSTAKIIESDFYDKMLAYTQ